MNIDPKVDYKHWLNTALLVTGITFFVTLSFTTQILFQLNANRLDRWLYPVIEDWTFRDWRYEDNGNWSVVIYMFKSREECVYVKEQIPTVLGLDDNGEPVEAVLKFIDDQTEGNNRPIGWQRLDKRVEIQNKTFGPGTEVRGVMLHDCGDELPFASTFGPVVIGENTEFPDYVIQWINSGNQGQPEDFR